MVTAQSDYVHVLPDFSVCEGGKGKLGNKRTLLSTLPIYARPTIVSCWVSGNYIILHHQRDSVLVATSNNMDIRILHPFSDVIS